MSIASRLEPFSVADSGLRTRRVFVRDLTIPAMIGVHDHEKERAQPIRVNLEVAVLDGAIEDTLDAVVCYEQLTEKVRDVVAQGHTQLVESLAERIAKVCLADPRCVHCLVRVEKLHAIPDAASVGVEIERSRHDFRAAR